MENDDSFPILTVGIENEFKKLKTIPVACLHLLASFFYSVVGIALSSTSTGEQRCSAYYVMAYLRVLFWIISCVLDFYVRKQHENLRLNGFHNFYRELKMFKSCGLHVVNLWNITYLGIQTIMFHNYKEDFSSKCSFNSFFSPIVYVTLFASLEFLVLGVLHGIYIAKVHKFNIIQSPPDAVKGSHISRDGVVGLTQRNASTMELLEKQADMINYLKEHNLKLNQKLLQLSSRVNLPPQI